MRTPIQGGCQCGAVRYEASNPPLRTTNCHCRTCQRASGAPFITWAEFAFDDVTWITGKPTFRISSDIGERGFCPECGGTLTFRFTAGDTIDLAVATMDDPSQFPPADEIWTRSRPDWMPADKQLPQHNERRG